MNGTKSSNLKQLTTSTKVAQIFLLHLSNIIHEMTHGSISVSNKGECSEVWTVTHWHSESWNLPAS